MGESNNCPPSDQPFCDLIVTMNPAGIRRKNLELKAAMKRWKIGKESGREMLAVMRSH